LERTNKLAGGRRKERVVEKADGKVLRSEVFANVVKGNHLEKNAGSAASTHQSSQHHSVKGSSNGKDKLKISTF